MEKRELEMFAGIEAENTTSLFDLYRSYDQLAQSLYSSLTDAVKTVDSKGSIDQLSLYLQAARDEQEEMSGIISEAISTILVNDDSCKTTADKFSLVAALLNDDRRSRLNMYRQALGLEAAKENPEYPDAIIELCQLLEEERADDAQANAMHDELMMLHSTQVELDYPIFIISLVTGDVDNWDLEE